MAQVETWFKQDLQGLVKVSYVGGNVFSQDNGGNLIGVEVFNNGQPFNLSGSISGNVIRSDGVTIAVIGSFSGNKASIILPQDAYIVPGIITIIIKNTVGSQITTLAACVTTVYQSSTDTIIDPGTIIPSIQDLIEAINEAVASIPADYSALWTSLAPAFSTSTNYTAGQYVTYNGAVYRFTAEHPAGTWDASDAETTSLGSDIASFKKEFDSQNSYLFSEDIPYGQTVEYDYKDLPVYKDHVYAEVSDVNEKVLFGPEGAASASVLVLPTRGIKKISVVATADDIVFTPARFIFVDSNEIVVAYSLTGNLLTPEGKEFHVEYDRLGMDYNTMMLINWIGREDETYEMTNKVTIEYFTREEWELSYLINNFADKKVKIFTPALTRYQTGKYMDNSGNLQSAATSNVQIMSPDLIDSIQITYEAGHSQYPSNTTPFAILKDKNESVISVLNPTSAGTFTMDINHAIADGGALYINVFDTNGRYHAWKSSGGDDIFCTYEMIVTKRISSSNKSAFLFKNYIRRPFEFDGNTVEFIGDSITEGVVNSNPIVYTQETWAKKFCEATNVSSYNNRAKAGSCYYDPSNPGIKSMLEQLQDVSTAPGVIFVAGGTNDWIFGTSLSNFRTAVDGVITYIKEHFASAKVIFITPINQAGWVGPPAAAGVAPLQAYRDIICEEVIKNDNGNFSIITGDSFNFPDASADSAYISAMFGDKLHPTELGYRTAYLVNLLKALC